MFFNELSNDSRRQLIDTQQLAEALRGVQLDLRHRFAGSMTWKLRGERDYLYRRKSIGKMPVDKALGPRTFETETIFQAFTAGKHAAGEQAKGLIQTLQTMAPISRAMGLGRAPKVVARILRRLDTAGVLGEQVCVVGTNALYAYEAKIGLRFASALLATGDLDIALDSRRRLRLAAKAVPRGLLGILKDADASFAPMSQGSFTAINKQGFMVDLITPEPRDMMADMPRHRRRLGAADMVDTLEDIEAVPVPRLEMIVDAPRVTTMALDEDGLPFWIAAADPRWWCAHKLWLAHEPTRAPIKRQRDHNQALAAAAMLAAHWPSADLSDTALAAIPGTMRIALRQAVASASPPNAVAEW